jgi:hypothetical protein
MRAIDGALPEADGVAWFTKLYLSVTEAVYEAATPLRFNDARFVRWLDVVFANLYFQALRGPTPKAWAPLLEARSRRGILPLQFALAGMNAHINRDLPVALAETWQALKLDPADAQGQYDDFTRVNALLEATEERVKHWFATGFVGLVDDALGRDDDVLAMWNVGKARQAAWVNAETLSALSALPALRARYLLTLDRMVGFAGRGLLRPLR